MKPRKRYCGMCDEMVTPDVSGDCGICGFETTSGNPYSDKNPREKHDDDGQEYADPRDFRDGLE